MGPHPDDFDAIGVTVRRLMDAGAVVHLAVMTTGANGVDAADYPDLDRQARAALREAEQAASCASFGLPTAHVRFLRLDDRPEGELVVDDASTRRVHQVLAEWDPGLVILPHPDDTNRAHQRTFTLVEAALQATGRPAQRLLNRDPKTRGMRTDVLVPFGDAEAAWKRRLLRHHQSQQRRNLRTRGHGLDDRILGLNAELARQAGLPGFAEAFELR